MTNNNKGISSPADTKYYYADIKYINSNFKNTFLQVLNNNNFLNFTDIFLLFADLLFVNLVYLNSFVAKSFFI